MKGAGAVMGFTFPGLDYEPTAQEFQHIQYLGSKKRRLGVWSEAGTSTSSEALSLVDSYLATGAFDDSAKAVDYSGFWSSNQERLPAASLWEAIRTGDYSRLSSLQDRMMLLLGLTELKRRWVLGMKQVGVDPFTADSTFDESQLNGVGGVNAQILWEYIYQRKEIVGRMKEVFGAPGTTGLGHDFYLWARNTVKPDLIAYLTGIDRTARNAAFDAYRAARSAATISAVQDEHRRIDEAAGIIPYSLKAAEARLETLKNELAALTDRDAISAKLTEIDGAIANINRLQDDVNLTVNNFWNEFSMESSHSGFSQPVDADMDPDRLTQIRTNFEGQMKEAMSYTISVMSNNMLFRELNRQSDAKVKQEKEDNFQSKVREGKAAAERMGESKKMQKMGEAQAAQRARAAKPKEKPRAPKNEGASPAPKGVVARKVK